jgi:cobalt-zinc-cadmium efflux system membrane fusion protein
VQFGGKDYIFVADDKPTDKGESSYRMVAVETGVSENGYTQVTLPEGIAASSAIVTEGAYSLLAKLKNAEEEE